MSSLEERVAQVLASISAAAQAAGRQADDITLVAVSKTHSLEKMNQMGVALRANGRKVVFGENYLQEYAQKRAGLTGDYSTHLIGPLQSNKVSKAVHEFDLIQSVHSEKVLRLINREAGSCEKIMPVFLQINISADCAKSGFSVEELGRLFAETVSQCGAIRVEGLMTITELYADHAQARGDFAKLRMLAESVGKKYAGTPGLSQTLSLSMGMSADFELAIAEGATHVRIGSALFGER